MNKYRIFIVLLLYLSVSCTDETENGGHSNQSDQDFRVTASIEDSGILTRVADRNDRTSFTENDPIFIGWDGSASYKYLSSGTNGVFVPNATDADRKLWSDLLQNTATAVDVYAWYGTMGSCLPAVGTTISIPQDQTSESKLLSAICMAAHQVVSPATNLLNFSFHHLTARLLLSVDIVDDAVTQTDVMDATARISHVYADGTIGVDASNAYQLSVPDDKAGAQSIRMKQSWSDQQIYHLDFECLLPLQTLSEGQSILITLANGKEYVCKISGEITLQAGQKTTLSTELKASDDATFKPKLTTIPDAVDSAFSGNRLICIIKNPDNGEYRYRVYDKQPDGSWGEGVLVYEDEEGTVEFPTEKYNDILKAGGALDMYGDYVGLGADVHTYFIKKSKRTGKWYCAKGNLSGQGYSICISENFLVSGSGGAYNSYIYPIDEDGNLGEPEYKPAGISAFKCSIYGNLLATDNGIYEYIPGTGWKYLRSRVGLRTATDGKRVIGENNGSVTIYNVKTGQIEGWTGTKPTAGVGRPVAIYEDYALVGNNNNGIKLCYRNPDSGTWSVIGPNGGFLEMMKHLDASVTITEINGGNLSLKGPRAVITDQISSQSFFIENIDKIVEDYLANPY